MNLCLWTDDAVSAKSPQGVFASLTCTYMLNVVRMTLIWVLTYYISICANYLDVSSLRVPSQEKEVNSLGTRLLEILP